MIQFSRQTESTFLMELCYSEFSGHPMTQSQQEVE